MSLRDRSVLVTGGAGFIGSHLVDRLITESPRKIVVVDNFFLGSESNLLDARSAYPDLEVLRLDASDLASMQDVVVTHEIETVFDLAVVPLPTSLDYPHWTMLTNIGITATFCEIARRGLIERLVHMSSSEAYGSGRYMPMDEAHPDDAITPYAASKAAEDHIIRSYVQTFGIDATVVRPFNNYGPRQNPRYITGTIITQALEREQIELGNLEPLRDFCFCTDGVRGHLMVAAHGIPGDLYVYGQGENISMQHWAEKIIEIGEADGHWPAGRRLASVAHRFRPGASDVLALRVGYEKLKRETGWEPKVSWEEGISRTIAWYAANRERWLGRIDWLR